MDDLDYTYKPITRPPEVLNHLKQNYFYCDETGSIKSNRTKKTIGSGNAGRDGKYKRICIKVKKKKHFLRVHHVVWFFNTGHWPDQPIDHIINTSTNHFDKLCKTSQAENIERRNIRNGYKQTKLNQFEGMIFDLSCGLPY